MVALQDMYKQPSNMNKIYMINKLFFFKMMEAHNVSKFFNDFNIITS